MEKSSPDDWEAAAEELSKFGVKAGATLIREAKGDRESAAAFLARVRDAIATATLNKTKFDDPARALFWFLRDGVWPREGVLSIEDVQQREEARQRAAELQAAAEAARRQARLSDAEHERRLQDEWGPVLDAFDREQLFAFAREAFANNSFHLDCLVENLRRSETGKPTSFVRLQLLEHLRETRGAFSPATFTGVSE